MKAIHPKVSAATFAAFLTTVIITECNRRGYTIDGNEGAALTGLTAICAGFAMPSAFTNGSTNGQVQQPPAPGAGATGATQ